jgi:hypothetical protein
MNHRTTAACGPPEACWIDLARVPHAPLFKPRRPVDSWKIIPGALDEHDITIATFVRTVRDLTGAIAGGTLEPEHVDWREFHAAADRLFELITD